MVDLERIRSLVDKTSTRIVLVVVDGLGGLPHPKTGLTELETARTPNFDWLVKEGSCGLSDPVGTGITPGSAPGILALLGYDPVRYIIPRGALEAVGIDFDLQEGDVAARGNFCTVDASGLISDRRAGRVATEKSAQLCAELSKIDLGPDVRLFVLPVKDHRFALVLRGEGLSPELSDTDPQRLGLAPEPALALTPEAKRTAALVNKFADEARRILRPHHPANMLLLRGFSGRPHHPSLTSIYKLDPAAVAVYPMYRGLARLVGMKLLDTGDAVRDEFSTVEKNLSRHDFFFVHVKKTDAAGEDGDFEAKVKAIEEVDEAMTGLMMLKPDVIVVTGDHSTPAVMKGHSWHPVPFLLWSRWCRRSQVDKFCERGCAAGDLGRFPAQSAMTLMLAHAQKLVKYGA